MTPIPIYLAVEDELSEWVVRRALDSRPVRYAPGPVYGKTGFGYLKLQAPAFNNAAKGCPFLLLTDLDQIACPPALISSWLDRPKHPHFLLRVAVREVESWLLGDAKGLAKFLGVRHVPDIPAPETLPDPKRTLLELAMKAPRRNLRDSLVWEDASSGRLFQGPDYNGTLARYVDKDWNLGLACSRCRSLERLFLALARVEAEFANK